MEKNENPSTISSYPSQKLRESLTTTTGERSGGSITASRERVSPFEIQLDFGCCLFAQIIEGGRGRGREDVRERESLGNFNVE